MSFRLGLLFYSFKQNPAYTKRLTQEDIAPDFCTWVLILQLMLSVEEFTAYYREELHCQRLSLLFQNCGKWVAGLVPQLANPE